MNYEKRGWQQDWGGRAVRSDKDCPKKSKAVDDLVAILDGKKPRPEPEKPKARKRAPRTIREYLDD